MPAPLTPSPELDDLTLARARRGEPAAQQRFVELYLGITDPAEAQAMQAAAEKHHASYNDALREMYLELGGDPDQAGDASAKTLTAFIEDQLDRQLAADIQRKIAQERAGLKEPPPPGAELPIEEQFWRMRAELGNDFERHVAESLGPERARKLRSLNDGWPGSTSVHSGDCVDTP